MNKKFKIKLFCPGHFLSTKAFQSTSCGSLPRESKSRASTSLSTLSFSSLSFLLLFLTIFFLCLSGCKSLPQPQKESKKLSRLLLEKGQLNSNELAEFFILNNQQEDFEHIKTFAQVYIDEAASEGINSDVAFAQMCLETGFLRFGGLVQPEWHNYCGLGAMDAEHPGEIFETEELGIRAHIQHLQAYATTADVSLNKDLVDPRYNWVHKTKYAKSIEDLAGTWATDPEYGVKIDAILQRMEETDFSHQ